MAAEVNAKSPQAQRMLKYAFNLLDDGLVGQQLFAGEATRLAYMTDEAVRAATRFSKSAPRIGRRSPGTSNVTASRATYAAEMPPLTLIACPVNRAAAGPHRNTVSAAMSSAVGTPR